MIPRLKELYLNKIVLNLCNKFEFKNISFHKWGGILILLIGVIFVIALWWFKEEIFSFINCVEVSGELLSTTIISKLG